MHVSLHVFASFKRPGGGPRAAVTGVTCSSWHLVWADELRFQAWMHLRGFFYVCMCVCVWGGGDSWEGRKMAAIGRQRVREERTEEQLCKQ